MRFSSELCRNGTLLVVTATVFVGLFSVVCSVYLPEVNSTGLKQTRNQQIRPKTNSLEDAYYRRKSPIFKNDKEIERYLKAYGLELMLWRCKNAIQPYWTDRNPLPFVELYCEVIGTMKKVQWHYNKKAVKTAPGSKYSQIILPHLERGHYYSRWIDFRLRIGNATWRDSGVYGFSATSPSGQTAKQTIYVDISDKKKRANDLDHDLALEKIHVD